MAEGPRPALPKKHSFALCFDGTGNEFRGDSTDSNVLRIFRLLDRSSPLQYSWYNPGLGTYIQSGSVDQVSVAAKFRSWYVKTTDLAFGSNVGDHVMAGYKFLMRYYTAGDDIYLFGFSRGAYTARFLAEMLDHIGLLSSGNEDLETFAWKCFSGWQARKSDKTEKEREKTLKLYEFMKAFRETFSRPVKRVRFLGLFDTVNSVPRFENAWLGRNGFPYTAKTSAKVIRHAVSLDERRAKFRVDLISSKTRQEADNEDPKNTRKFHRYMSDLPSKLSPQTIERPNSKGLPSTSRRPSRDEQTAGSEVGLHSIYSSKDHAELDLTLSAEADHPQMDHEQPETALLTAQSVPDDEAKHAETEPSQPRYLRRRFSDLRSAQDILEVWFSGNHGDVGGGWRKDDRETWPLAHQPLVWIVNEAQRAGLLFDPVKMAGLNVAFQAIDEQMHSDHGSVSRFQNALLESSKSGVAHDCLEYKKGASNVSVAGWKLLEYLFLEGDPLATSRGEVRDVPKDAKIHRSVIDRMDHDHLYRPGNLIMLGSGGRGQRKAPAHLGKGQWVSWKNKGDRVGEIFIAKVYADEIGHRDEVDEHQRHHPSWWPRKRKSASRGSKDRQPW